MTILVRPIKAVLLFLAGPLVHICNLILETGVFPDKMKVACVKLIFKGAGKNDLITDLFLLCRSFLKFPNA